MATTIEKRKQRQTVVASAIMVPDGFVRLSSFGTRPSGGRGSAGYEVLLDAYQRGKIDAYKVMLTPRHKTGPVFVDATQAAVLIDAAAGRVSAVEEGKQVRAERAASVSEAVRELHERIGRLLVQAIRMEMQERGK